MGIGIVKELEMISMEFECGGWVAWLVWEWDCQWSLSFYKQEDEEEYKMKLKTNANINIIWFIVL